MIGFIHAFRDPRRTGRRRAALFAAWLLISGITVACDHAREHPYATFMRPDGRYRLVVVAQPGLWRAVLPGQAGDAPGVLRLYDRDGRLLQETKVDMVQLVERVEWEDRRVRVKLIADWALPD